MESKAKFRPDSKLRLMDQVKQVLRYHHYSYRTEQTYSDWILRYVRFHGAKTHPKDMGKKEVEGFLSHLATEGKVPLPLSGRHSMRLSSFIGTCLTNPLRRKSPLSERRDTP